MSKRIRAITLCSITALCCLALIVVGTYAMFSETVQAPNHLQAGELKVRLYRDKLACVLLTDEGLLKEFENNNRLEFTKEVTNIFGLNEGSRIVPGCDFEATFTLENCGNVAINYYLEFVFQGEKELAEQLELTLSVGSEKETIRLSQLGDNYTWGSAVAPLGRVLLDSAGTFSVELEFVDDNTVNNDAQNQKVAVDMIVHAIQATN